MIYKNKDDCGKKFLQVIIIDAIKDYCNGLRTANSYQKIEFQFPKTIQNWRLNLNKNIISQIKRRDREKIYYSESSELFFIGNRFKLWCHLTDLNSPFIIKQLKSIQNISEIPRILKLIHAYKHKIERPELQKDGTWYSRNRKEVLKQKRQKYHREKRQKKH